MSRYANYFASVSNGKVVALTEAFPAHELTENQVMLTSKEYRLLMIVDSLEEAKEMFDAIKYKISQLGAVG